VPLSRNVAGTCRMYGFEADLFHVINVRPAADERIEDSTDLVRPIIICVIILDITLVFPSEW
jgi:hypothetical protein